jgi:hypothetical protein
MQSRREIVMEGIEHVLFGEDGCTRSEWLGHASLVVKCTVLPSLIGALRVEFAVT